MRKNLIQITTIEEWRIDMTVRVGEEHIYKTPKNYLITDILILNIVLL